MRAKSATGPTCAQRTLRRGCQSPVLQFRRGKGELPMRTTAKRELYTLCDILMLLAVLGLVPLPHAYGENIEPLFSQGSPTDLLGRVAGRRAGACDRLLDLLEGRGINKKCLSAGSSSGI